MQQFSNLAKPTIAILIFFIFSFLFFISAPQIGAADCPKDTTCPDTSNTPVYGNTLPVERNFIGDPNGIGISGGTGPQGNALKFPKLKEENSYFSNSEFIERALPAHLLNQGLPEFEVPEKFDATLAHVGCGPVIVNGEQHDLAFSPSKTTFSTTKDYNDLLVRTRFWQSIFVPGKDANLKFRAEQPTDEAQIPGKILDCPDGGGSSLDYLAIENPLPEPLGISFTGILNQLQRSYENFLRQLTNITGVNFTVNVKANIEQVKYMPGEIAFNDQTVGEGGFLNFFRPEHAKFTKHGDQEEPVDYQVVGDLKTEGVVYKGMTSFQSGKLDLENSIFPEGLSGSLAVNPVSQNPISGKLDFVVPYMDPSVKISEAKKQETIKAVKKWYPDTLLEEYWNLVVDTSVANGINPAFTLAIWIEESKASSRLVKAASPFGCFPGGDTLQELNFADSLQCFIHFTAKEYPDDFVKWVKHFCGPIADPVCSNNPNFLYHFRRVYNDIIPPGTHGAAQDKSL